MSLSNGKCLICKKKFNFYKSAQKGIFCSVKCHKKHQQRNKVIDCKNCLKPFWNQYGDTRQYCSRKCYGLTRLGINNVRWAGDNLTYAGVHKWINSVYGKANRCEGNDCSGMSTKFEWSLIRGKLYARNRDNFRMLCIRCHRRYDLSKADI